MRAAATWHVGLTVSDLDAALHFYVDLLGFELVARRLVDPEVARALSGLPDPEIEITFLDLPGSDRRGGNHDLELVRSHRPIVAGVAPLVTMPGAPHLALVVDDATMADKELRAAVSSSCRRPTRSPAVRESGRGSATSAARTGSPTSCSRRRRRGRPETPSKRQRTRNIISCTLE